MWRACVLERAWVQRVWWPGWSSSSSSRPWRPRRGWCARRRHPEQEEGGGDVQRTRCSPRGVKGGRDRRRRGTDVGVEEEDVGRRSSRSDVDEEEVPERLQLLAPGVVDVGVEDHDADVLRYPGAATSMAAVVFSSGWGWFLGWWLGFTEEEEEKEKRGVAAAEEEKD